MVAKLFFPTNFALLPSGLPDFSFESWKPDIFIGVRRTSYPELWSLELDLLPVLCVPNLAYCVSYLACFVLLSGSFLPLHHPNHLDRDLGGGVHQLPWHVFSFSRRSADLFWLSVLCRNARHCALHLLPLLLLRLLRWSELFQPLALLAWPDLLLEPLT